MSIKDQVINKSIELLEKESNGIRFTALVKRLEMELPDIKPKNFPGYFVILKNMPLRMFTSLQKVYLCTQDTNLKEKRRQNLLS